MNFTKENQNFQNGFTLIESLIYIAIIGLVLTSFVMYGLFVSAVRNKNYAMETTQSEGRAAFQILEQKIRAAKDISIPSEGTSGNQLILIMPNGALNLAFSLSSGVLQMTEGGGAPAAITSSRTKIDNLVFTNLAAAGEKDNIKIEMTISYNAAENANYNFSQELETAVSLRQ